jgi:hypothetical protein
MAGAAPTCSTCGAILSGYGWSEEINCMVYFCPQCKLSRETRRVETKRPPVQKEELDKAA